MSASSSSAPCAALGKEGVPLAARDAFALSVRRDEADRQARKDRHAGWRRLEGLASDGGFVVIESTGSRSFMQALNVLRWRPPLHAEGGGEVGFLVLGDSWVDNTDMDFTCWPSLLAERLDRSLLLVGQGGSVASDLAPQARLAGAAVAALRLRVGPRTVAVVHCGGNDILHNLPPRWFSVQLDLIRLGIWRHARERFRPCARRCVGNLLPGSPAVPKARYWSFVHFLAHAIVPPFLRCLDDLYALGVRRIIHSAIPLSRNLPLARFLVARLMLPLLGMRFAESSIKHFAAAIDSHVCGHLKEWSAAHPDVVFSYFEEGAAMDMAEDPTYWKDGHHMTLRGHELLADAAMEHCRDVLGLP